ncbi:hypothetical protein F4W70_04790 [Pseudomonas cannabina]|nr:hypothetical protein F4W70_04790 [Pseudomonas cannabina]
MSAMGCEAALKPVTLAVSGTPRRLVLLPVPGSSRTSPLPHSLSRPVRSHTSEASPGLQSCVVAASGLTVAASSPGPALQPR